MQGPVQGSLTHQCIVDKAVGHRSAQKRNLANFRSEKVVLWVVFLQIGHFCKPLLQGNNKCFVARKGHTHNVVLLVSDIYRLEVLLELTGRLSCHVEQPIVSDCLFWGKGEAVVTNVAISLITLIGLVFRCLTICDCSPGWQRSTGTQSRQGYHRGEFPDSSVTVN